MESLLVVTAVLEGATGLTLLVSPAVLVALLLGSSLETPAALTVGRVAGAAVLALSIAGWLARHDGRAATGLIAALLVYNVAVAAILAFTGFGSGTVGIALWPVVVLHAAPAVWCVGGLRAGGSR